MQGSVNVSVCQSPCGLERVLHPDPIKQRDFVLHKVKQRPKLRELPPQQHVVRDEARRVEINVFEAELAVFRVLTHVSDYLILEMIHFRKTPAIGCPEKTTRGQGKKPQPTAIQKINHLSVKL